MNKDQKVIEILGHVSGTRDYLVLSVNAPWEWLAENQQYLGCVRFRTVGCGYRLNEVYDKNKIIDTMGDKKITFPQPIELRILSYDSGWGGNERGEGWVLNAIHIDALINVKER